MNSKAIVLLKTMLLSTSSINLIKHSNDKKKKKKARGAIIGKAVLYIYLTALFVMMAVGYGVSGIAQQIPAICITMISTLAFVFTIFRTNGYLFNFKEYDMLMSMPFEAKSIVACKFLYMYIKTFSWYACISIAMLVGFGIYQRPAFYIYPMWIVLTLVAPLIPTVLASLLGAIIAKLSSGFRFKKAAQIVFTFALIFFCFFSRYFIEAFSRNGEMSDALRGLADNIAKVEKFYLPMLWFDRALADGNVLYFIIMIAASVLVFAVFYNIVARFYVQLNSKLATHEKSKAGKPMAFKKKSIENTIAFKELKRMMGSVQYMTQAGFGFVFIFVLSVVVLFVNGEKVVAVALQGAPVNPEILIPSLPFLIYFFTGMVSTTAFTPSLEGKNNWIMQSMPLTRKQINHGKMLFNLYMQLPFTLIGVICFGICFRVDMVYMLAYILCGICLCLFSTTYGMFCGLTHIKLEWENDIEVVKQSTATTLYLLPNMFITMGLMFGTVFLSMVVSGKIVLFGISAVYGLASILFYKLAMKINI